MGRVSWWSRVFLGACISVAGGCTGLIGEPPRDDVVAADLGAHVARTGLRRLSAHEYDKTVRDLLGYEARSAQLLPSDERTPFDNEQALQAPSQALIEAAELLAAGAAAWVVGEPQRRERLVGCTPSAPGDVACLRSFVSVFGRRAFRRPLSADDVEGYARAIDVAIDTGDFYDAVEIVVLAMLQDPRFLYRVELASPRPDDLRVHALDGYAVATRLSYFLWGTTPSDELLDAAGAGQLDAPEQVAAVARRMLEDPRAREQLDRFHALWLGYETLPHTPELAHAMRRETRALIDRVVFERRAAWRDLFTSQETFVDATLAQHYGLSWSGGAEAEWIDYGASGRRGILSQGAPLSLGFKFGDTSPTQRGIEVRARLLCEQIPNPPPGVDVDEPPQALEDSNCKWDRFAVHRTGGCAACHEQLDPIGFGLERFDQLGRYREHDPGYPECAISGEGTVVLDGSPTAFSGPAELAEVLIDSGRLERCAQTQLYRFAQGRHRLGLDDERFLASLADELGAGFRLDDFVVALVGTPGFLQRRELELEEQ